MENQNNNEKKLKHEEFEEEEYEYYDDPECFGGDGNMEIVNCYFCVHTNGADCKKLNCKKLSAPVDLFNCPYFEKKQSEVDNAVGGLFKIK